MLSTRPTFAFYGLAIACLLSACGGSGSTPTQVSSGSSFLDSGTSLSYSSSSATSAKQASEFQRLNGTGASSQQSPFEAINAHQAYGYGVSGSGQTINIMDSSFATNHQEIAGKTSSFGTLGSATNSSYHGLAVASIAAGKKDGNGIHGVAYNADLHFTDYTYYGGQTYLPDRWAQLTNDAANNHQAIAQNNSWGLNVTLTDVTNRIQANGWSNAQGVAYEFNQGNYTANANAVDNYVQALNNFQTTGVIVYALSNSHSFNEADFQAALPELFPQLAEAWITTTDIEVTGTSGNLSYSRQSAKCGSTAAYCLGADGTQIVTAKYSSSSTTALDDAVNGTSFTAPQVSGAIALLAEAFPNHTPAQLVDRLLASANNDFFSATAYTTFANGVQHGYNSEFGHGLLDLGAAMEPIINTGSPRMVTGANLQTGTQYTVNGSQLQVSASFGDSLYRGLVDKNVYVYDALNGGFAYPLSNTLQPMRASTQQTLSEYLDTTDQLTQDQAITPISSSYNLPSGWQIMQPLGSATLVSNIPATEQDSVPRRVSMLWQSAAYGRTRTQLEAGIHHSPQQLLGLQGKGALNLKQATGVSQFTNFSLRHQWSPYWQLDLQASAAISQLSTPLDSLIQGFEDITSSTYRLAATRQQLFAQDQLRIQISQPQRINGGYLSLNMASLADPNGNLNQQTQQLPLRTSGKQIDIQLDYQLWLGNHIQLGLQHLTSLQPNHTATAAPTHQQTISLQGDVFGLALGYDVTEQQPSVLLRWQGDL